MKLMKRSNIFQASNYNVTFDPNKIEARSYKWWSFVSVIEGKVIFNNYRYSVSTSKHQRKVRSLIKSLNIKVDIELSVRQGLQVFDNLNDLFTEAEEQLCDQYLESEIKRQDRNLKAKHRRAARKLEQYLENEVHFRDYEIREARQFGHINKASTVNQLVEIDSMERDVESALHSFHRDGFGSVIFYV